MPMDPPDNTEVNLNISLDSDYFFDKPPNQSDENDFFLTELYKAHWNKESENKTDESNDTEKENGIKSDSERSSPESPEMDSEKILEPAATVQILIENLKSECIKYKNIAKESTAKFYQSECLLAECEVKLSEAMKTGMTLQIENETLKERLQAAENEAIFFKTKMEEFQAEIRQFKNLVQKQLSTEDENSSLRKELSDIKKAYAKLKKQSLHYLAGMNSNHKLNLDLKRENKRILAQHLEFCELLVSKNSDEREIQH